MTRSGKRFDAGVRSQSCSSVALEPENHGVSHLKYDGKASRLRSVYLQERQDGVSATLCDETGNSGLISVLRSDTQMFL